MKDTLKLFIAGVVGIGLASAIGMHAKGLASFTKSVGQAGGGLITSAEGSAGKG